jgi:hypothetical protein
MPHKNNPAISELKIVKPLTVEISIVPISGKDKKGNMHTHLREYFSCKGFFPYWSQLEK